MVMMVVLMDVLVNVAVDGLLLMEVRKNFSKR
jgi:hypothetical protein